MNFKSIRIRLFVYFMLLAGVPVVLVGGVLAWRGVVVQKRQAVAMEREVASSVAERIKAFVLSLEEKLRLSHELSGLSEASPAQREESLRALLRFDGRSFRRLTLIDGKGEVLADVSRVQTAPSGNGQARSDQAAAAPGGYAGKNEYLIPKISGRSYFGPIHFDAESGEPVMPLAAPLRDPTTGTPVGAVVAECGLGGLWESLAGMDLEEGERVYVLDGEGRIVAGSGVATDPGTARFSAPERDGLALGLSGEPAIVGSYRLDLGGRVLDVTAERRAEEALSLAKETVIVIAALLAASLVFGSGLAYLLVRRLVRPIRALALTARAVKNGDYSRRAEVGTDDEIGELAQAFNSMTAKLTETMAGLTDNIGELTETQARLRDSEGKYRLLAENAEDVIWTIDRNLDLLYCSPSLDRLVGKRPDEVLGRSLGGLLVPESFRLMRQVHERQIQAEDSGILAAQSKTVELEMTRQDGGTVWVECVLAPMRNENGGLVGYMGVSRDIGKRRLAEEALRQSEERFRAIADYTCDWECWFGGAGELKWVNPAVERVTGYTVAECMAMENYPLPAVAPADREMAASYLRFAAEGGAGRDREFEIARKDGERAYVSMSWQPIYDSAGASLGFRASLRDVTQRRLAEEALKQSETKYRMLHEQASEGIVLIDAAARILDANPRARELLGYGPKELRAVRYQDLLHPDDMEAAPLRLPSVLTGETVRIERLLRKKNGEFAPFDVSARMIGENLVQLMLRDMTERKRAEEELRRSRDLAESANRAKGEFVARVSHELRNPLSGILGMTDLVLKTELSAEQREYLGMVRDAAGALLSIINDLLDFSKMEAGRLELRPEDFNLADLLSRIMKDFGVRAKTKGIELKLRTAVNVPSLVRGDPLRLAQVIRNFLDNAVKFTEVGGVSLDVRRVERPGDAVKLLFQIRDTGPGIAGEDLPKLFQSFSQVERSYNKNRQGTGLGLSIAKQLTEMMGGSVWVESKVGKGASFYFTAVFEQAGSGEDAADGAPSGQDEVYAEGGKLKVLLAEDNVVNRTFLSHFLADAGHKVTTAANGREVLELMEREHFDVALMDVQMPEMDGLEAARRIRRSPKSRLDPDIPIVALTAYAMREDRERFLAAGMNACVSKPVNMEELFRILREAAGGKFPAAPACPPPTDDGSKEPETEGEELLDLDRLKSRFKDKRALLDSLVGDFLVSVEAGLDKLAKAVAGERLEESASLAHSLVNAAIPIGSKLMVSRGRDLEHAARNYGVKGTRAAYERLTPVVGEVLERLRRLKSDRGPEASG